MDNKMTTEEDEKHLRAIQTRLNNPKKYRRTFVAANTVYEEDIIYLLQLVKELQARFSLKSWKQA